MSSPHQSLPATRRGLTHHVVIGGFDLYLTANRYDDGRLAEIFAVIGKEGSLTSGMLDCWCRAVSWGLHRGLTLADMVKHYEGYRFEPNGSTTNPAIPECQSLVDYIVRWLAAQEPTAKE